MDNADNINPKIVLLGNEYSKDSPRRIDITKSEIKYIVIGGYVHSQNDNQKHYISAPTLCRLYGVSLKESILAEDEWGGLRDTRLLGYDLSKYRVLRPRSDGSYKLEE